MTILTEPMPGWTEGREAAWQEMRVHTAQGTRHLTRVEGGWGVSEYRNSEALECIEDGALHAWVRKHGVTS